MSSLKTDQPVAGLVGRAAAGAELVVKSALPRLVARDRMVARREPETTTFQSTD
jgi:hypothetical protein